MLSRGSGARTREIIQACRGCSYKHHGDSWLGSWSEETASYRWLGCEPVWNEAQRKRATAMTMAESAMLKAGQ